VKRAWHVSEARKGGRKMNLSGGHGDCKRQAFEVVGVCARIVTMEQSGNILLVDDNDDDAFFIEKAFKSAGVLAHIFRCLDGREVKNYLLGEAPFADRGFYPLPDIVLLDLKIPYSSGLEVLRWIRAQPNLRGLIVLILTASSLQRDIDEAYAAQANCFLTKPSSLAATVDQARAISLCWLKNLPTAPQ
jgi:CheY-like chemotaxis protein